MKKKITVKFVSFFFFPEKSITIDICTVYSGQMNFISVESFTNSTVAWLLAQTQPGAGTESDPQQEKLPLRGNLE